MTCVMNASSFAERKEAALLAILAAFERLNGADARAGAHVVVA